MFRFSLDRGFGDRISHVGAAAMATLFFRYLFQIFRNSGPRLAPCGSDIEALERK